MPIADRRGARSSRIRFHGGTSTGTRSPPNNCSSRCFPRTMSDSTTSIARWGPSSHFFSLAGAWFACAQPCTHGFRVWCCATWSASWRSAYAGIEASNTSMPASPVSCVRRCSCAVAVTASSSRHQSCAGSPALRQCCSSLSSSRRLMHSPPAAHISSSRADAVARLRSPRAKARARVHPCPRAVAGFQSTWSTAAANPSASPSGTSVPVLPPITAASTPPERIAMTGSPAPCASR